MTGTTLTTRPVTFRGSQLFVNANCSQGELRAEVLDLDGEVIKPFTLENCAPVTTDRTLGPITWQGSPFVCDSLSVQVHCTPFGSAVMRAVVATDMSLAAGPATPA